MNWCDIIYVAVMGVAFPHSPLSIYIIHYILKIYKRTPNASRTGTGECCTIIEKRRERSKRWRVSCAVVVRGGMVDG